MTDNHNFDVIIIGGSYAGLSAAMALGRSLRNVLIIDSGLPCNRQTPHSHNFITQDGEKPGTIAAKAKAQVLNYNTVKFHTGLAVSGEKIENGFEITTQKGEAFKAKKLIFATGIKDIMPSIKGFSECWGISAIHCPYCHGYEFRNQKTGIMANGEKAFHIASLVNNLTNSVTVLTSGKADFNAEQLAKLNKHNIKVAETEITEIEHENGHIKNVVFSDGNKLDFTAVYAAVPFTQHSDIPVSLGCELTEQGYIRVNNFQKTTLEGVFACGDNTAMMRSVANAVYSGNLTGAMVNKELTDEQF
ncbi:NAD(P)/FAD-dependent oxidoreductase [Pontibacter toksunensis]|uniref:NAD(P)/FAD-dependent oxidoreductase n=1 Tax=Pontibacter toksunensis TaxID=1332631 RepID=A0ABW6BWK1_9BACT